MNYVRVGGYIPPQPIEDYNDLPNIPVISQDLTASGFTPIANTYYKHTGTTTASYTNGVIYYYNSTGYIALDGSAYGLATVAKTGSYNDLSNKPTIPDAANNGTLTIQKNGTNVATFGANQSTNTTANITVPTKASDIKALPISGGSITGDLTVGGNLTINGTTTTVDSTTLQVKDKLIEVAHGNTTTLTTPAGLVAPKYDGTNSGALVFDSTGTAYVGDVKLDSTGNIDVAKSELQPLATRTGLVGGNLVQYDSSAQTLKDSGKKISDLALTSQLPTVNNGKLTIQKNGTTVETFTANQSANTTANITVPIKVSELTNDSGYTTNKGTVTSVSVKMNDASKGTVTSSGTIDLGTVLTDASKFATAAQGTKADNAMPKSGGEFTGGISAPNISTGTNAANYFQSQKFRGEGNADTYSHAVDFGFAGHNQVDFHEYGGLYNFYQNTAGASDSGSLVGAFTPDGIKEGEQLLKDKYLGKSGGTITGDLTVGGNFTVSGTTTTVDSTTLKVSDKLIEVAKDNTAKLTTPAGIVVPKYDGTSYGALVIDGDGNAQVGDVKLDTSGNIDVANSDLQILATRTGLVGGNLVQYDSSAQTLKDSGKKISDLALKTDLNGKASLSGGNTFSGVQTINAPTNVSGSEQTTMKVKTSNGGAIIFGKEGANSGTMIRLDQADGTCRLRFRSSKTAGAMVWEQPEQGAHLYVDLGKDGSDKHRVTFPSSAGTLALTSQVNAKYTKPSGGIPKTDLASDVQTSLGKADNALSLDGGTIKKSKTIKMDASANSDGANLKWGTVNSKNPYIGYASDQVDGTFVVGSLLGTNYASGLAIGGGSGNLLWKGAKVATTSDIPDISGKQDALSTAQMAAANSGITAAKVTKYDGYESTINGKQAAITASNKLSASLVSGLATVATSGSYSDLENIPTDIAKVGNISNPNLLINPNFAINQRGQTSYTGAVYGVDRWKGYQLNTMVCTPNANGVTLTAPESATGTGAIYRQVIEPEQVARLAGKTITFSFMATNRGSANIYMRCLTPASAGDTPSIASGETKIVTKTITLAADITELQFVFRKSTGTLDVDINWVKLEIGSVATEFSPPSIAEELPKCYRYFIKLNTAIMPAYSTNPTSARYSICIPTTMRITPTINFSSGNGYIMYNGKSNAVTANVVYIMTGNIITITATTTGLSGNIPCSFTTGTGVTMSLDAEI